MKPTLGRIVLVRNPQFVGECPGIITAVLYAMAGELLNVHVFTNDGRALFVSSVGPQESGWWGWRWPPRDDVAAPSEPRASDTAEQTLAPSAESLLAKV